MAYRIHDFEKIIPDAYHGTDIDTAEKVAAEQKFIPSNGNDDYLGCGVYFFESSKWHAKDWAIKKGKKLGFTEYAVLNSRINLGRCLDLNNMDHRNYVKDIASEFKRRGATGVNDAIVINFFASKVKIDTVRANYVVPGMGKIFEESRFYSYSCSMICVRDTDKITDINIEMRGLVI